MKKPLLLALFACTLLASCQKSPDLLQSNANYTFTNNLTSPVTLDFYGSKDDYANGKSRLNQHRLEAGASLTLPLEVLKTYWLDWYTDGYGCSNWSVGQRSGSIANLFPPPELKIANQDDNIFIRGQMGDSSRSVLLNGSGGSSVWQVNQNGTHTFLFRKDLSYVYNHVINADTVEHLEGSYVLTLSSPSTFRIFTIDNASQQQNDIYYNGDPYSYPHFGRDTLMVSFPKTSYYDYYPARRL